VRLFGCFGFTGRRACWPAGLSWLRLGGHERDCQEGTGDGDEAADDLAGDLLQQVRVH
jgi:hypothetical protein